MPPRSFGTIMAAAEHFGFGIPCGSSYAIWSLNWGNVGYLLTLNDIVEEPQKIKPHWKDMCPWKSSSNFTDCKTFRLITTSHGMGTHFLKASLNFPSHRAVSKLMNFGFRTQKSVL